MEQQRFFLKGRIFSAGDAGLQDALARLYDTPERPRCLCIRGGVEMYIAKFGQYVVKRMPESGPRHHPTCPSFEPEYGQSGLGELMGDAVIERSPESIEVRLDFPLSRFPGRPIPRGEVVLVTEVTAPRRRMTVRALMHFLWERAGFNRWYPAMQGKRSWAVLRKYLLEAAEEIETKGVRLAERLYLPEPFREEAQAEIAERRREKLALLNSPEDDVQCKMALVLGEFKAVEGSAYGKRIWIKHMPDCPLQIEGKAWERIERGFKDLFENLDADTRMKTRLILCALVYAKREHLYQVDTASLMLVTESWIPIEGVHEVDLIHRLTEAQRRFIKPLRYDARTAAVFPNALLIDTGDKPTPLHVVSPSLPAKEQREKERAIERGSTWVWRNAADMPDLPAVVVRRPVEHDRSAERVQHGW